MIAQYIEVVEVLPRRKLSVAPRVKRASRNARLVGQRADALVSSFKLSCKNVFEFNFHIRPIGDISRWPKTNSTDGMSFPSLGNKTHNLAEMR